MATKKEAKLETQFFSHSNGKDEKQDHWKNLYTSDTSGRCNSENE